MQKWNYQMIQQSYYSVGDICAPIITAAVITQPRYTNKLNIHHLMNKENVVQMYSTIQFVHKK